MSISSKLHHHQRWDGKGYPMGLDGEDIPYLSRELTLVDIITWYERKNPKASKEALRTYLQSLSGLSLDPNETKALLISEYV